MRHRTPPKNSTKLETTFSSKSHPKEPMPGADIRGGLNMRLVKLGKQKTEDQVVAFRMLIRKQNTSDQVIGTNRASRTPPQSNRLASILRVLQKIRKKDFSCSRFLSHGTDCSSVTNKSICPRLVLG